MTVHPIRAAQDHRTDADAQIQLQSCLRTQSDDECLLPRQPVVVAVAEVVHDQQRVDHQSAGQRSQKQLPRDRVQLHIIRAAYGHNAEEQQHERIAQPLIREIGRIEKCEHHAHDAHEHHLRPTVPRQRQPHDTSHTGGQSDGLLHRVERHPPLGTGASRSQSGLGIVGAVHEVEEVVNQVRVDLHRKGEEQTKHRCRPVEHIASI